MIDTHCHLEQPDYDVDRDAIIQRCKRQLQAVITSCVNPNDFEVTMQLVKQHRGFVFASTSVHPSYVHEIDATAIEQYIEAIHSNKGNIVAIGETGLDYNWIREAEGREKQKQLFIRFIELAEHLQLPLVIHSRDAVEETVEILENYHVKSVQMHMFTARSLLRRVIDNGWFISVNTLLLKSKGVGKLVRDCPLGQLMLETDSPWLGVDEDGKIKPKDAVRNEPIAVHRVAEKVAAIKNLEFKEIDTQTTNNAREFFKLTIS